MLINANFTQKTIEHLRKVLDLDALPKVKDPVIRKEVADHFLLPAQAKQQKHPEILGIGGGPGSGKDFYYERLKATGRIPAHSVIHDPDSVMQCLPQYQNMARINPVMAFRQWELPARQLANEILYMAIIARYHIIYLRSFALSDSLEFMRCAKNLGYRINIHMLTCDHDVALVRSQKREKTANRHFPPEKLIQRHKAVSRGLPEIECVADHYFLYENSHDGSDPVLLYKSET